MNNKPEEVLAAVGEEVFEDLAFVLVMPDDGSLEHDDCADSPDRVASIRFQGPFEGTLFLRASEDLMPMIAANMLGLEDDEVPSPEQMTDAFRELLNVICGNLLPRLVGDEPVFAVNGLQILEENCIPPVFEGLAPVAQARFSLEIGRAELALFTEREVFPEDHESEAATSHTF